jgi:hypothetical protein
VHLIVQALLCGAAVLRCCRILGGSIAACARIARQHTLVIYFASALADVAGEVAMPHTTDNSLRRAPDYTWPVSNAVLGRSGRARRNLFRCLLLLGRSRIVRLQSPPSAALLLAGLLIFEWCFVMADRACPTASKLRSELEIYEGEIFDDRFQARRQPSRLLSSGGEVGRLGRTRSRGLAAPRRKALSSRSHDLLQLRIGLRPARLRRTKKPARSRSSKAIPCIRPAADGSAPRARRRSIRFTIPIACCIP